MHATSLQIIFLVSLLGSCAAATHHDTDRTVHHARAIGKEDLKYGIHCPEGPPNPSCLASGFCIQVAYRIKTDDGAVTAEVAAACKAACNCKA